MKKLVKDLETVMQIIEPTSDLFSSMQQIKIILANKEEEMIPIIHTALCNGLAYIQGYGLSLVFSDDDAKMVTDKYNCHCIEDVLINHLKMGSKLSFWDDEGEEEVGFNLDQAISNLQNPIASKYIGDMRNEDDDAITADCILQICLFNDIIYG